MPELYTGNGKEIEYCCQNTPAAEMWCPHVLVSEIRVRPSKISILTESDKINIDVSTLGHHSHCQYRHCRCETGPGGEIV